MSLSEAEELEMLELEEEEANTAQPQAAAPGVSTAAAMGRGGLQGASFGFADELGGATQAALQAITHGRSDAEGKPLSAGDVYHQARNENRAEDAQAEKQHGLAYGAAELGGGIATSLIPAGAIAKGGGMLAKTAQVLGKAPQALRAAGMAGLYGAGASEADTAGGVALEAGASAAAGGLLDKGLRVLGSKIKGGKLAQRFAKMGEDAGVDQIAERAASKDKAVRSATGALGGEAADIIRSRDVTKQASEELAQINPELAARLKDAAASPEAMTRLQAAAENYLPRLSQGLENFNAKEGDLLAAKARDPVAEAAEKLAHPVKDFFDDRMQKHLMNLVGRPALMGGGLMLGDAATDEENGVLGKTLGAGAGFGLSLALGGGRTGDVIMNRLRSPATRKLVSDAGQKALGGLGTFAEKLARPAVLETSDDPDKWSRLAEYLRSSRE